jgi:hypothetical protein
MNKMKLVLASLFIFLLSVTPRGAFGQAAAEAGLVTGLSSVSTAHAASNLGAATNRALQGAGSKVSAPVSAPATTTAVHKTQSAGAKVASSKGLAASTKSGQSGVATSIEHGAKLPDGIVHVWPEGALTQTPVAPQ